MNVVLKDQFFKERMNTAGPYHFNLYGYDTEGNEVLLTKDHILPKSKGGTDHLSNL